MSFARMFGAVAFATSCALLASACDDDVAIARCRPRSCGAGGSDVLSDTTLALPVCTESGDVEPVASPAMRVAELRSTGLEGFDLDGINNAPRGGAGGGSGKTIAGCNASDLTFGRDAAFETAADALDPVMDVHGPFELGDLEADLTGASTIQVFGLLPDDLRPTCVRVALTLDGVAGPTLELGGDIEDHRFESGFVGDVLLELHPTPEPSSCDGPCVPASLRVPLRIHATSITLDATNSHIVAPSTIGGIVFFRDETDVDDSRNATGLRAAIERYAAAAHLTVQAKNAMITAFASNLDLRVTPDGIIVPCTAPGGNASLVNRNSISISIALVGD